MSKPITVYVPVKRDIKAIYPSNRTLVDYLKFAAHIEDKVYTPSDQFIKENDNFVSVAILDKKENVYVHTPEELLELKKKWCKEAFQSGYNFCMDGIHAEVGNKETYVNNLTIE